jgi:ubiquinone/menaquinone biosynthesis C-methylase UbiE
VRDFRRSLEEAARVLRRNGRMVVMMLNPESDFYKERISRDASYVARIRHSNIDEMEKAARSFFEVDAEFFLGVEDGRIFENRTDKAVLKILNGIKR